MHIPGLPPRDPPQWLPFGDAVHVLASAPRGPAGLGQRAAAAVVLVGMLDPKDALGLVRASQPNTNGGVLAATHSLAAGMSLNSNAQPRSDDSSSDLTAFWTALDLPLSGAAPTKLNAKNVGAESLPSPNHVAATTTTSDQAAATVSSSGKATNEGTVSDPSTTAETSAKVAVSPRLRPKGSPPSLHSKGSPRPPPPKRMRSPQFSPSSSASSSPSSSSSSLTSASSSTFSSSTFSSPPQPPRAPRTDSAWRLDDQSYDGADAIDRAKNAVVAGSTRIAVLGTPAVEEGRRAEAAALRACVIALLEVRAAAHAASCSSKASKLVAAEAAALAAYLRHACPPRFTKRALDWSTAVMQRVRGPTGSSELATVRSSRGSQPMREFGATTRRDGSITQRLYVQDESDDKELFNAVRI